MPEPKGKARTRVSKRNQAGGGGMGGQRGSGRGMGRGGGSGLGAGGNCVCPKCGATAPHQRGEPCTSMQCPSCGATMTREV